MASVHPAKSITIVGVGLIGGSIGLALRHTAPETWVGGVDHTAALRVARRRGVVSRGHTNLARGLRGADLVVLALPVDPLIEILPQVARHAPSAAVITDVAGVKQPVMAAARRAGLARRFVGGHPMAGSERAGATSAAADLFRGAPWILCPGAATAGALARVRSLVTGLGGRPFQLSPRRHDAITARLSHLPQLLGLALVNLAGREVDARQLRLAGPAFAALARLADSPPDVWEGVLRRNRPEITRSVDGLIGELRSLRGALAQGAAEHFRRASRVRRRMTRHRRV
jgi:prephenate dehydrogenase